MGYLNNKLDKVANYLNAQPKSDEEVDVAKLIGGGATALAGTGAAAAAPFTVDMAFDQAFKPIDEIKDLAAKLQYADRTGGRDIATNRRMLKALSPEARNILAIGSRHARRVGRDSEVYRKPSAAVFDLIEKRPLLTSFKAQRLPGKLKILAPVLALGGGAAAAGYGSHLMDESLKGKDLSDKGGIYLKNR